MILVSIWGLRLTIYLAIRNIGKKEDFRYQEFRRHYGINRYWWVSFFQVFLLQGVLILLVSLPLLGSNFYTDNNELMWLDYMAIIIWITGFIFEYFGDKRGDLYFTKEMLLAVGDEYEKQIAANREADAPYR